MNYGKIGSVKLLDAVTAVGAGELHAPVRMLKTFMAHGSTSAGAGTASVNIEVSNVDSPASTQWIVFQTIDLTLSTTVTCDGFDCENAWKYVRANLTSLAGTDATVTVWMGG